MSKIGIELINLPSLTGGGGGHVSQLINGLAEIDRTNEYILFLNKSIENQIRLDNQRFHKVIVNVPRYRILPWSQLYFIFSRAIRLYKIDLLHSPASLSPLILSNSIKTVITVHDLAIKLFPETCSKLELLWCNIGWPRCFKKVKHIVTVSENTKRDIIKFYGLPEDKITVIYPYVPFKLPEISEEALVAFRARYGLPERYILQVGLPYKRKNLALLLEAFQILKKRKGVSHKLVLVGPKGREVENIFTTISKLNIFKEVILTGFVPDTDLLLFYQAADVFVFPSLYEGFGYPPLEAMVCGTPVVVSGTSSLPEVVGDAGLFVDPLNPEDIAEKIFQVISSSDLHKRLREAGLKRVGYFSKEKMINSYLEVYKKVLKK
jgi:glycosyltransferase involved in cell wall biosynthesis